jgi:hypothetical protein
MFISGVIVIFGFDVNKKLYTPSKLKCFEIQMVLYHALQPIASTNGGVLHSTPHRNHLLR